MRQLLRVTGERAEGQDLNVVRDTWYAVNEIREQHPNPDILYFALGEDYFRDAMTGAGIPSGDVTRNWWEGGTEIRGYPAYIDVDLPPRAFQVVWTR